MVSLCPAPLFHDSVVSYVRLLSKGKVVFVTLWSRSGFLVLTSCLLPTARRSCVQELNGSIVDGIDGLFLTVLRLVIHRIEFPRA